MPINWAMINRKKQDRWNRADESKRFHILEERELQKKIKHLSEFIHFDIYTGEFTAQLFQGEFANKDKKRVIEWCLKMHYGLLVHIVKLEGLRFIKEPNCPPIIEPGPKAQLKVDKRLEMLKKAQALLKEAAPEEAAKIGAIAEDIAAKMGPH